MSTFYRTTLPTYRNKVSKRIQNFNRKKYWYKHKTSRKVIVCMVE
ncbi:hypothetical protein ACVXZZ_08665 [Staphylococcus aureus]